MKVILVHADDGPGMPGRLSNAVALARRVGGHVTLLVNTPFQRFVAMDPFGGTYLASEALAEATVRDAEMVSRFTAELAGSGVSHDIVSSSYDPVGALSSAALLADLAVVALEGEASVRPYARPFLAGDLALAAPVPVLALPEVSSTIDAAGPAIIAWNGRAEAAAALRAAVPLLQGRPVALLRIGAESGPVPDAAALDYLHRQGIDAALRTLDPGDGPVGEVIEQHALSERAAMIVMGAFGRSRLRETLFGGVTRYLLGCASVPLLLAH